MLETFDDLWEELSADVDMHTRMPGPAKAISAGSRRRTAVRVGATAAAITAGCLVLAALTWAVRTPVMEPQPAAPGVSDLPVWFDDEGLHHGDDVWRTAVDPRPTESDVGPGALALVSSGAVYLDPSTGDVWFHPWTGDPRVIGRNSLAGPGGDPDGDVAAWFEGSHWSKEEQMVAGSGTLVLYDTASGQVISRTEQQAAAGFQGGEHVVGGSGFLEVSPQEVVWWTGDQTIRFDVQSATTSRVDVADQADAVDVSREWYVGHPGLERMGRLNSSGAYLLAVEYTDERHGAVIVDLRGDSFWRVPRDGYPWITWSYGDLAMVDHTKGDLLACDASAQTCDVIPTRGPVLLPTS